MTRVLSGSMPRTRPVDEYQDSGLSDHSITVLVERSKQTRGEQQA